MNVLFFITGLICGVIVTSLASAQVYEKGLNDGRSEVEQNND